MTNNFFTQTHLIDIIASLIQSSTVTGSHFNMTSNLFTNLNVIKHCNFRTMRTQHEI